MVERRAVSWTILICGCLQSNQSKEACRLYADMRRGGNEPDYEISDFVISALMTDYSNEGLMEEAIKFCVVHCGFVEEALGHFNSMTQIYEVTPKREHYASMVGVLCQNRGFDEAEKLMAQMPFESDEIMWFNSCRSRKNHKLTK
ncbi:putative pentatricopeptide repeat-containing protein, partial [Cucurbita argyrosperma subsp. argyrosperma]